MVDGEVGQVGQIVHPHRVRVVVNIVFVHVIHLNLQMGKLVSNETSQN